MVRTGQLAFIEMRPRDAAAALEAGTVDGAFVATDIAMEHDLEDLARLPLGSARSSLVLAVRDDGGVHQLADLAGGVVATHMPNLTARFLADAGVEARVLPMGGSLEGLCAAGLADAIVDNTETGTSLRQNNLSVLATIAECEAEFVHRADLPVLADLELRIQAALGARAHRYVMLHIPPRPGGSSCPPCSPAWPRPRCCPSPVGTTWWPRTSWFAPSTSGIASARCASSAPPGSCRSSPTPSRPDLGYGERHG